MESIERGGEVDSDLPVSQVNHDAIVRRLNGRTVTNAILADLPEQEYETVQPHLDYQEFPTMRVLNEPEHPVESVYFMNSGLASLEVPVSEGTSIEVGVAGCSGFVGIPLLCGVRRTLLRTVVQIRGSGYRIKGDALEGILRTAPQLELRMKHYALLQGMQVAQIAACNRLHDLEQRLARWLLGAADRVGLEFPITQEHLAQMLGTGRASLSVVASRIRKTGVIQYARGSLRILDRPSLEMLSCECYEVVRRFNAESGLDL